MPRSEIFADVHFDNFANLQPVATVLTYNFKVSFKM